MSATPVEARPVTRQLKAVVWKGEQFWLGRLVDHPEIMSQGETVEELEANLRDAWRELLSVPVPG